MTASVWGEGERAPGWEDKFKYVPVAPEEITAAWRALREAWERGGVKFRDVDVLPPRHVKIGGLVTEGAQIFVNQIAVLLAETFGEDMVMGRGTLLVRQAPTVLDVECKMTPRCSCPACKPQGTFVRSRFGFLAPGESLETTT